jgi:hypothetical protein
LTRLAAFGIGCVMLVAIVTVHWPHGFFMNWYGNQKGEGFEYHLLALGIAVTLTIVSVGAWSLDGALARTLALLEPGFGARFKGAGTEGEQQSLTSRLRSSCISLSSARPARTASKIARAWAPSGIESR